jgi:hypothetical protein
MLTRRRSTGALFLAVLLLSGCADDQPASPAPSGPPSVRLAFEYLPDSGPQGIDEKLTIYNREQFVVAPVLRFTALDEAGNAIPGVSVLTAFGSERGQVVVPPGQAYDLLQFTGTGSERVVDVDVDVVQAPRVEYPPARVAPSTTALGESGAAARSGAREEPGGRYRGVKILNSNDTPITVRVVYVVWEAQFEGYTQPWVWAYPVGDLHTVPAKGSVVVELEGEALALNLGHGKNQPTSFEAYYSL